MKKKGIAKKTMSIVLAVAMFASQGAVGALAEESISDDILIADAADGAAWEETVSEEFYVEADVPDVSAEAVPAETPQITEDSELILMEEPVPEAEYAAAAEVPEEAPAEELPAAEPSVELYAAEEPSAEEFPAAEVSAEEVPAEEQPAEEGILTVEEMDAVPEVLDAEIENDPASDTDLEQLRMLAEEGEAIAAAAEDIYYDYSGLALSAAGARALLENAGVSEEEVVLAIEELSSLIEASRTVCGTMTMSYEEFYDGKVTETVDAVSSATTGHYTSFVNADKSELGEEDYILYGVKNVPVRVQPSASAEMKERVTELEEGADFAQYWTVDANGITANLVILDTVTTAEPELVTNSHWADYELEVVETDTSYIRNTRSDEGFAVNSELLGVVISTAEGGGYGLWHLRNVWLQPYLIGFNAEDENIEGLVGQTITSVTYIMQDGSYEFTFADGVYVKEAYAGEAETGFFNEDLTAFTLNEMPEGLTNPMLTITYSTGSSYNRTTHTLLSASLEGRAAGEEYTLEEAVPEGVVPTVQIVSDNYSQIAVSYPMFGFQEEELTALVNEGKEILENREVEGYNYDMLAEHVAEAEDILANGDAMEAEDITGELGELIETYKDALPEGPEPETEEPEPETPEPETEEPEPETEEPETEEPEPETEEPETEAPEPETETPEPETEEPETETPESETGEPESETEEPETEKPEPETEEPESETEEPETEKPEPETEEPESETEEPETETPEPAAATTTTSVVLLKGTAKKTSVALSWNKVQNADGYSIYSAECGGKMERIATVKGRTNTSYTAENLSEGTSYKFKVKAYKVVNGKRVVLKTSYAVHTVTKGGKHTNVKSVKVSETNVNLSAGDTQKITAETKLVNEKKKVKKHEDFIRFVSTNKKVAKVNANGKITAVAPGTCKVYAIAANGARKKISVTVH